MNDFGHMLPRSQAHLDLGCQKINTIGGEFFDNEEQEIRFSDVGRSAPEPSLNRRLLPEVRRILSIAAQLAGPACIQAFLGARSPPPS